MITLDIESLVDAYWVIENQNQLKGKHLLSPDSLMDIDDFAQFHPDFPHAIRGMITYIKQMGRNDTIFQGTLLKATLDLVVTGGISFERPDGGERVYCEIEGIRAVTDKPDCVEINGKRVMEKGQVIVNDRAIPFAADSGWLADYVQKEELEWQYPGWEQRWQVAVALSLPASDWLNYIFNNATNDKTVELPAMNL